MMAISAAICTVPAKPWAEATVRREIAGILQVLVKLHRGQLLHRDLTPLNVFVCDDSRLKLGDFGIVRQQSDRRGVTARTLNPHMAPSDIFDGAAPKWQARDDVYQVGQLLGMLVKGDAHARIRTAEVRGLPCSDHLKEIVYRCIGERRKRYESADELIDALSNPPASLKVGALRTLKGRPPGLHRHPDDASKRGGGGRPPQGRRHRPQRALGPDVGCRSGPAEQASGALGRDAGIKLMEIKRLREKGHRITILNEAQFWRLARKLKITSGEAPPQAAVNRCIGWRKPGNCPTTRGDYQ